MNDLLWYNYDTLKQLVVHCKFKQLCDFIQNTSNEILTEIPKERFTTYDLIALKRFASGVLFKSLIRDDLNQKHLKLTSFFFLFLKVCRKLEQNDQSTVCWNFNQLRIQNDTE